MTNFDNTFIRGPSPNNYSDDGNSENGLQPPLSIKNEKTQITNNNGKGNPLKSGLSVKFLTVHQDDFTQGRNTFAFWTLVILLFVLTVGNLILTMTIIGVLRLGKGMQNLELVPEADTIKFFGVTDLDRIYKKDGILNGFDEVPVTITGEFYLSLKSSFFDIDTFTLPFR